jgi:GxxExxY protein
MENEILTGKIIAAAIEVHRHLGPGLLESAYHACLTHELYRMGIHFEEHKTLPLIYKSIEVSMGYRLDILVEDRVIIELKAVESLNDVHSAQIITYLKVGNKPTGLLINFNIKMLKSGIKRFINNNGRMLTT